MFMRISSASCVIVLCFYVAFVHSFGDLVKGDACHHDGKNLSGTCASLKECPEAIRELKIEKSVPQICTFEGNLPIVCCLKKVSRNNDVQRIPGEISKKKCLEYGQLVYKQIEVPFFKVGSYTPTYINDTECAVHPTFVHGGVDAKAKEFPHMALLGYGDKNRRKWGCGGSLISKDYVLTAAHCLSERGLGAVRWVRLGDFDISITTDDALPQEFEVKNRIRHPRYKRPSSYHDIALLELDRPVTFTDYVRPACLHTSSEVQPQYLVSGWGHLEHDVKQLSNILQRGNVEEFTLEECTERYEAWSGSNKLRVGIIDDSQICAGGKTNDTDTCPGDSGGPLQIYHKEVFCMYSIVGVTSFGQPRCGVTGIPAIYTRVSNYISWIENIVWP